MIRRIAILPVILMLFGCHRSYGAPQQAANWKAGVAKVAITPTTPVWMAGYAGRTGPSDGLLVDLYARTLALSDSDGHRLVIVAMDVIEIPASLRTAILDVAIRNHSLQPEELLLNVSHTHGGPMVSGKTAADWGIDEAWQVRADGYVTYLVQQVDSAIGQALKNQQIVQLSYSRARCGFAMNRRQKTSDGFRLGMNPDGPVDHDVPVLRVERPDKNLVALVFGYACHNTSLGPTLQVNGDYAGFAQKVLEQDHPDTVSLFITGCGGDQDPAPRRHLADAEQNGKSLAMAVEDALAAPAQPLDTSLSVGFEICPLPFAPLPPRDELKTRAQSGNGFVARHAQSILRQWPNPGDQPPDYSLPIQVIKFGKSLTLVALGGEPVVDYSLRLKKELAKEGHQIWVAGYSNLVSAYVPSRRVLSEGGYEGTEAVIYQSLPGPFQPTIEDRILETVHRQFEKLSNNSTAGNVP